MTYLPANNVYFEVLQVVRERTFTPNFDEACKVGSQMACDWLHSADGKARRGDTPLEAFQLVLSQSCLLFDPLRWRFNFRLGWDP